MITFATISFLGLPLLAILLLNVVSKKTGGAISISVGYVVAIIQMIAAVVCMALLWMHGKDFIEFSLFWDMNATLGAAKLSVDLFSLVVLFCIGMVSLASLLTAKKTIGEKTLNYTNLLMVIMLGMNGIAVVTDLFSLYVFLEITGIASFVLIALLNDKRGLEGAFKYLVMSAIASALILGSFALIFTQTGSLVYGDVAKALADWRNAQYAPLLIVGFVMFIAGFSIKAGIAPFHGWLPDAYQSAPASVSVLLGGIVTKMAGVYALIRVLNSVFVAMPMINNTLLILGLISIVFGAVAACGQKDFKRILAYSSISQIGYIILGVASGSLLGFVGAMLHFFNHATFKTTLFVNSAAVEMQTGTTDIDQLGGLQARMPVTAVSSILAFLSMAGIPPLAGFWSKLLIIIAVWQSVSAVGGGIALAASIFTAAYFLILQRKVFFGPLEDHLTEVTEAKGTISLAAVLLSIVTVAFGVLFPVILNFLHLQGIL